MVVRSNPIRLLAFNTRAKEYAKGCPQAAWGTPSKIPKENAAKRNPQQGTTTRNNKEP
jgi:hypothetical protein